MLRTVKIAVEYIFYIAAFVSAWAIFTSAVSFIYWENYFTHPGALAFLRICIVAGFGTATVTTIILISNNKI